MSDPLRGGRAIRRDHLGRAAGCLNAWKEKFPEIPWSDVASIGNVVRHNYHIVDQRIIFELQGEPIGDLERVIRRMRHIQSR